MDRAGARRERIEFEWTDGVQPGFVTLTESFVRSGSRAPSAAASSFFGVRVLEGSQRERLTQRRGISNPYGPVRDARRVWQFHRRRRDDRRPQTSKAGRSRVTSRSVTIRSSAASAGPQLTAATSVPTTRAAQCSPVTSRTAARPFGWQLVPSPRPRALYPYPQAEASGTPRRARQGVLRPRTGRELGLAHYRTELVGNGARQYLVIERYDRAVDGETVTLIHQEDAAQALGLDWVDDQRSSKTPTRRVTPIARARTGSPSSSARCRGRGSRSPTSCAGSTFTVLLGDNDAHAKNLAILHLPGRSVLS